REGILKTAKVLVEDTKVLVQNATVSQEKLAQDAQSSVSTITHLVEVVKLGAASLGSEDPETPVVLINTVKYVSKALEDLISATKAAAGKAGDDPAVYQLKNSAKVMVTNVTSLLKTVKAVEDEATKGTRALEATIEHIRQELAVSTAMAAQLPSRLPLHLTATTHLADGTKDKSFHHFPMATAKAVDAGNSCQQEDVIAMANLNHRFTVSRFQEATYHPEVSKDVCQRVLRFGKERTDGYLELLEHVLV
ncbi:TLN1 protein, partial [Nyctiprogne leucopyga]|nr:TLN1 protein [Nyctiprogne leucopyga]